MVRKVNIYRLLYYFVVLYAIATMTQDLVPQLPLNRIFYFGIFACVSFIIIVRKGKFTYFYTGIILLDMLIVHIMYDISGNILDYIYFVTSLFWLFFLSSETRRQNLLREYQDHQSLNNVIIVSSVMLVVFALVSKTGYTYSWDEMYFVGFSGLTHTAASSMCLIGTMILLSNIDRRFNWAVLGILFILCFGIFETGARTYIVPAVLIIYIYMRKSPGKKQYKYLLYALGAVFTIIILTRSNIMDKFDFTSNGNMYSSADKLTQQTSGRSTFWLIDLKGFAENSIFAKLFGRGHGYTYYLNKRYYDLEVWAHNDFIQLLVGGGIVTLLIYLSSIKKCFRSVLIGCSRIDKGIFFLYWFVAAFFNGFYNYSHYFLSFVMICLLYDKIKQRGKGT